MKVGNGQLVRVPQRFNNVSRYLPLTAEDRLNLFFHHSIHRSQLRHRNKYESDDKDETICPLDFDTTGMITYDIIRKI